jgi:hypothetical protein
LDRPWTGPNCRAAHQFSGARRLTCKCSRNGQFVLLGVAKMRRGDTTRSKSFVNACRWRVCDRKKFNKINGLQNDLQV